MRILLTNDDGIHAPGIQALAHSLQQLGDVKVVAPLYEQSGVGLSITYLHPILVREHVFPDGLVGNAVNGSPADCVKLGVLEFCKQTPDLVVSGINSGANVGINVMYSGTVAGAIEGAFFGITSIAVSLSMKTTPDFPLAAERAVKIIGQLLERKPPQGSLWNLNLPATQPDWPLGVQTVRMGVKRQMEVVEKRIDPRGRPYYWSGLDPMDNHPNQPGTDIHALASGYATVTPLHFDLTSEDHFPLLQDVEWQW